MLNVCNQFRVERLTFTADHLVNRVSEAVDVGLMSSPSSPSSQPSSCLRKHPKFTAFVVNVLSEADVTMSVILTTLLYVTRSKPHLRIPVDEWALERVFLGALIIASKYLNDSSLKNADWAAYSGFFSRRDIGRIEREFLESSILNCGLETPNSLLNSARYPRFFPRLIRQGVGLL
ncbi:hypothetical protein CPB85DRAFT_1219027 [Mucidula mucida]|nr:hypothetical protein CPB85DRAFT_1219027 [Mucidula mucida]